MRSIFVTQGGGHPNSNTAQLIDSFVECAVDAGNTAEVIALMKDEAKGCLGYNACRYGKLCVQKDAFNDLAPNQSG